MENLGEDSGKYRKTKKKNNGKPWTTLEKVWKILQTWENWELNLVELSVKNLKTQGNWQTLAKSEKLGKIWKNIDELRTQWRPNYAALEFEVKNFGKTWENQRTLVISEKLRVKHVKAFSKKLWKTDVSFENFKRKTLRDCNFFKSLTNLSKVWCINDFPMTFTLFRN